jgi:hypothetical protein
MIASIRELGRFLGRPPSIAEALDFLDTSLDELLKRGLWSDMLADAGLITEAVSPDRERLAKGLQKLGHVDDADQIRRLLKILGNAANEQLADSMDSQLVEMLHVTLWGEMSDGWSVQEAHERLRQNPAVVADIPAILEYCLGQAPANHAGRLPEIAGPLTVHSQYTRDEILVGLGHWTLQRRPSQREGVLHLAHSKVDAFFVTLQKTEEDYSPTTMYEDWERSWS